MLRPWYRSKWLRIGGLLLLLVLAAAVVVPVLVPADRFRPLLVRSLEGHTGRRVQIDALRLYLLPTVHLQAVNIRVKNVAFGSYDQRRGQATPLFTVSGLNARIQHTQPDEPDWKKGLELTSDLRGVQFSTPAVAKPVLISKARPGAASASTGRWTTRGQAC